MAAVAQKKESTLRFFQLSSSYHYPVKGVTIVSDSKNPENGERVPVKSEFPRYVLVPNADVVTDENGRSKKIKYIYGCPTHDVEKQMEMKWVSNPDADRIEVIDNSLIVDEAKNKVLYEFLCELDLNESKKSRNPERRGLIKEVTPGQEEKARLQLKYNYAKALIRIEELGDDDAKNLLLKKGIVEPDLTLEMVKERLSLFAENDPDFVLKGVESYVDRRVILVHKAIEQGFISVATPARISWMKDGKVLADICKVGDLGGIEGKVERFIAFLGTEDGKIVENRIVELVGNVQYDVDFRGAGLTSKLQNDPSEEDEDDNDGGNEWSDEEGDVMTQTVKKRGRPKKS